MKKVLTILFIFLLSVFFISTVKAEEKKYYELRLDRVFNGVETTNTDNAAFDLLIKNEVIKIIGNDDQTEGSFMHGDTVLVNIHAVTDQTSGNQEYAYSIPEGLTQKDNFVYDFTEEDLQYIISTGRKNFESSASVPSAYLLEGYDGIKVIVSTDCDEGTVCVVNTVLEEKTDTTVVINEPTVNGLSVGFDVSLDNVNDLIKYKILIRNKSDEDYQLKVSNFKKSDYIKYEYTFEDGNNTIKANSDKVLYVTIKYDKEVPADVLANGFTENNILILSTNEDVVNPKTGQRNLVVILVLAIVALSVAYVLLDKKPAQISLSVLAIALLIPLVVNALSEVTIKVNTKVEVLDGTMLEARYDIQVAEYDKVRNGSAERDFWEHYSTIETITFLNEVNEPNIYAYKYDVSAAKDESIWAYLIKIMPVVEGPVTGGTEGSEETTEEFYDLIIMSDKKMYANPNSSYWFAYIPFIQINGLEYLDTSKVTNMEGMFMSNAMGHIFDNPIFLENNYPFQGSERLGAESSPKYNLDLSHFDTRNVTNMSGMFANRTNLEKIYVSDLWDTSKVTASDGMFNNCTSIVGARGTIYDFENTDKLYARVDKQDYPGYFSVKEEDNH